MGTLIVWAVGAVITAITLYPELIDAGSSTDREAVAGLLLLVVLIAVWPLLWITAAIVWMGKPR